MDELGQIQPTLLLIFGSLLLSQAFTRSHYSHESAYTADTSITAVQAMTLPIKKTAVLTVRLAPKVKASLKAAADAERRSLANMLEVVVIEYCEKRGIGPASTQKRVKAK